MQMKIAIRLNEPHNAIFLKCVLDICTIYELSVPTVLEYGSSVLDPHTQCLHEELENVLNRAERFVTGNYVFETGSMTDILGQLKWESLKKRRKDSRLKYTKV